MRCLSTLLNDSPLKSSFNFVINVIIGLKKSEKGLNWMMNSVTNASNCTSHNSNNTHYYSCKGRFYVSSSILPF